jgi:hypothetical protein
MQAPGNSCCRLSVSRAYCGIWKPATARNFHASRNRQTEATEATESAPTLSVEDYSQVQINPESKTVTTAVGSLPISPLMDPAFHEARLKFKQHKEPYVKSKSTKFQRLLARNPYGNTSYSLDR